jgi:hypothetical protein
LLKRNVGDTRTGMTETEQRAKSHRHQRERSGMARRFGGSGPNWGW